MTGLFITLEGPEGSGKSTHAVRLADRLKATGREVVSVREPGGTATGEEIRKVLQHDSANEPLFPETETLLFAACRAQLVRQVILPALTRGCCVVCDRFADSTTAYQGYGRGFGVERMLSINAFAIDGAQPDLTLLLDLPVRDGFDRIQKRNKLAGRGLDRMEREGAEFHEKVRDGYLQLARRWPDRFRVIQSGRPLEDVAEEIWDVVREFLARTRSVKA
jgi:dTMP kinase